MGCFGSKDKKPKGGAQGNTGTGNGASNNPPATQLQERKTNESTGTTTQPNKNRSILAT